MAWQTEYVTDAVFEIGEDKTVGNDTGRLILWSGLASRERTW